MRASASHERSARSRAGKQEWGNWGTLPPNESADRCGGGILQGGDPGAIAPYLAVADCQLRTSRYYGILLRWLPLSAGVAWMNGHLSSLLAENLPCSEALRVRVTVLLGERNVWPSETRLRSKVW